MSSGANTFLSLGRWVQRSIAALPHGFIVLASALCIGLLASWRVLLEPGVVGLVHDWSIFPFPEQHLAYARQLYDGWFKWGLGLPVTFPTEYPLRFSFALAAALGAGGAAISKAVVFGVPSLSFLSAYWTARRLAIGYVGALVAALFYASNPVVLNKLVSGQTAYVEAYVCLPLVIGISAYAFSSKRLLPGGLLVGSILALCAAQIQVGLMAAILLFVFVLACSDESNISKLRFLAIAYAVLILVHVPTVVGISSGMSQVLNLTQFSAKGLQPDSVEPLDMIRLLGYVGNYQISAVDDWATLWTCVSWAILVIVLLGLRVMPPAQRVFGIVTLVGLFLLMAGNYSIIAPLFDYAFKTFSFMQAFRELYHFMAGVALIYALSIGHFITSLRRAKLGNVSALCSCVLVCLFGLEMLSGDASGWLQAFPIDKSLAAVFNATSTGSGEIAWLPMEQPLAFKTDDFRGSGVDPMNTTPRGSLWLYTLQWPLTAVDMLVRTRDPNLPKAMYALGVGTVVQRNDVESRLREFITDGPDARAFFESRVEIGGIRGWSDRFSDGVKNDWYDIRPPLPSVVTASRLAMIPERLATAAAALSSGMIPVPFDASAYGVKRYDVVTDPDDSAAEALQASHVPSVLNTTGIDARTSFAPISLWWWLRPCYADIPSAAISIGRHALTIPIIRELRHPRLVVGWVSSGVGGGVKVSQGTTSFSFSTQGAEGEWMSKSFPLKALQAGDSVRLLTDDDDSQVVLRAMYLVDAAQLSAAEANFRALLDHAVHVGDWSPARTVFTDVRRGSGKALGQLRQEHHYRLMVEVVAARAGRLTVYPAAGQPLALSPVAPGRHRVVLSFPGTDGQASLQLRHGAILRWDLEQDQPQPSIPLVRTLLRGTNLVRTGALLRNSERYALLNQTFSDGWLSSGSLKHIPSALGTNVFVYDSKAENVSFRYRYSRMLHYAFIGSSVVLLLSLLIGSAGLFASKVRTVRGATE